ncbi:MAG: hypothetical protein AAB731_04500, partial [Patescibacteria group bacterium]
KNPDIIYILTPSGIYSFDLSSLKSKRLNTLPLARDYIILKDKLWFLSGENLKFWDFSNTKAAIETLQKVSIVNPKFRAQTANYFGLSNNYEGIIVDADRRSVLSVTTQIKSIIENPSANHLLVANDNEIWLVEKNGGGQELVTRLGEPIIDAAWHQSKQYIIFATEKEIQAIELDNREPRNKYNLIKLQDFGGRLQNDGDYFYFIGKISDQEEGIFKLEI